MSIKSDKWIRRMAEQHGMIEPFAADQVRYGHDGGRIDAAPWMDGDRLDRPWRHLPRAGAFPEPPRICLTGN